MGEPLSNAAQALTSMALREDAGAVATLGLRYPKELVQTLANGQALNEPFSNIMEEMSLKNKFVINWLDMLCFLLQGLPASGTMNAVIAYMLADWYRPGVTLDFPKGGSGAIVDALVRGVVNTGNGKVQCNSHVEEIIVEDGLAKSVKLKNGKLIRAKKAIVSNADPYVTKKLLQSIEHQELQEYMEQLTTEVPDLKSFIHIHAGIDASGLPTEAR